MAQSSNAPMTLGIIVGNRGFFPGHLASEGRGDMIAALTAKGIKPIALEESDSKHGAVESLQDARKCADLFKKHREEIDGVVVTLPNFGDERAIANTLRWANLGVPVLVQATPDTPSRMLITDRGQTLRTRVDEIRETGRNAQGVKIMTTAEGERIVALERLAETTDGLDGAGGESILPPSEGGGGGSMPPPGDLN